MVNCAIALHNMWAVAAASTRWERAAPNRSVFGITGNAGQLLSLRRAKRS